MNQRKKKFQKLKNTNISMKKTCIFNEFLEFNIYNQKLSFNSSLTEECQKGCFLLIAYYSHISNSFGSYDRTDINIHYYSTFIPYETESIDIEIQGRNILAYFQEGVAQINTQNMDNNIKKLFDKRQDKMIIRLNKMDTEFDSFKGKYISFAFKKDINDTYSYYYFRVLHKNSENKYMINPLDMNKENFCETKNNKCYFLLKNNIKTHQIK